MGVKRTLSGAILVAASLALGACGGGAKGPDYDPGESAGSNRNVLNPDGGTNDGLLSNISPFGKKAKAGAQSGGLGVNSYLWRASLDTLSFMPIQTLDSTGGVIITDWHANPHVPNERFKVTVYILDKRLRADGIKVSVFRQEKSGSGIWQDAAVNSDTAVSLENAILVRARQFKVDAGR